MPIRTVAVHVTPGSHALDFAMQIAAAHSALLVGVHPVQSFLLPGWLETDPSLSAGLQRTADRAASGARAAFERATAGASVDAQWVAPRGDVVATLATAANAADLMVVRQDDPKYGAIDTPPDLATFLVFAAGGPVLVVPSAGAPASTARNVLIAWNNGREAARAVRDALPLLRAAQRVAILTVGAGKADSSPIAISEHLGRHGIRVETVHSDAEDASAGEVLLADAARIGADLIVMGAYGHSRLREQVLGGATRTMLREMPVPVLFSR